MTTPTNPELAYIRRRVEWYMKVQTELPSNYDRRVSVHADDLTALLDAARLAEGGDQ